MLKLRDMKFKLNENALESGGSLSSPEDIIANESSITTTVI